MCILSNNSFSSFRAAFQSCFDVKQMWTGGKKKKKVLHLKLNPEVIYHDSLSAFDKMCLSLLPWSFMQSYNGLKLLFWLNFYTNLAAVTALSTMPPFQGIIFVVVFHKFWLYIAQPHLGVWLSVLHSSEAKTLLECLSLFVWNHGLHKVRGSRKGYFISFLSAYVLTSGGFII